jgi:hypothetical protein
MLNKIKPYLPWVLVAVATCVIIWLAWELSSARTAKDALAKALEAEKIVSSNLILEMQKKQSELKADLKELLANNSIIKTDFERLEKEVGKVKKVVEIIKVVTVDTPAGGIPRPDPDAPPVTPGAPGCETPAVSRCLLAIGDMAHIEIQEATVAMAAGNQVVLGSASAWRTSPEPKTKLFESGYSAKLTNASIQVVEAPYTWGAGAYFGFSKDGIAIGPAGAFPTFSFFGLFQMEVGGGIGLNPYNFSFQGGVTALGRFR